MHELVLVENHIKPTTLTSSNMSTGAVNDEKNESGDDFQVIDEDDVRVNIDLDKQQATEEEGLNDREEVAKEDVKEQGKEND